MNYLAVVSAVTALIAVVISPLVSIYVVRKQVNAQVIATNRQNWINELRTRIATYITEISVDDAMHLPVEDALDAAKKRNRQIHQIINEVSLYINPIEPDHQKLVELMRSAAHDVLAKARGESVDSMRHRGEIIKTAQTILKREWERVKKAI